MTLISSFRLYTNRQVGARNVSIRKIPYNPQKNSLELCGQSGRQEMPSSSDQANRRPPRRSMKLYPHQKRSLAGTQCQNRKLRGASSYLRSGSRRRPVSSNLTRTGCWWRGLRMEPSSDLHEEAYLPVLIESDNLALVHNVMEIEPSSSWIEDCEKQLAQLQCIQVVHCPRETNQVTELGCEIPL